MPRTLLLCLCLPFLTAISALAAERPGLLGHWKLDDAQGDLAVDSSGNGNDAEVWDADWVQGPFGAALAFNGTGAHVRVPQIAGLDGSDEMTVEAWVYWEGTGRYPNIVSGGTWSPGGFLLFVQDGNCSFRMGRPGRSAAQIEKRMARIDRGPRLQFRCLGGNLFRIEGRLAGGTGEQPEDRIEIGLAGEPLSHRVFQAFDPCGQVGLFLAEGRGSLDGRHNHQGGGRAEKLALR